MRTQRKTRYKQAEGKHLIEVSVKNPLQLFDARDPSPFRERDLDDDLVEYITASAREIPLKVPMKLVIRIEGAEKKDLPKSAIRDAIHEYLAYRIELQRSELRMFIRRAQAFLLVGLLTLFIFLSIAQSLKVPNPPGLVGILREGLVILGWISVWKPVELIMFDWYPLFEIRRLFQRLLEAEIDVHFTAV